MTDRYAVIGNPIEHSLSPLIHGAFARQTGEALVYDKILGDLEGFEEDVRRFFAEKGKGLNVTVPFKERAWRLADKLSDRARRAGAANTLLLEEKGGLMADNTDGVGLVRDLAENQGFDFTGKQILLVGAGGASRGVAWPLLEQNPAGLVIANRTSSKAESLADALRAQGAEVEGCGLDALAGRKFDLIINGTAAGLKGKVPAIPDDCLAPGGWIYDMMYGTGAMPFVSWGKAHGAARAFDGLGMLVEQAAESFYLWRGVRPDTQPVIEMLRAG